MNRPYATFQVQADDVRFNATREQTTVEGRPPKKKGGHQAGLWKEDQKKRADIRQDVKDPPFLWINHHQALSRSFEGASPVEAVPVTSSSDVISRWQHVVRRVGTACTKKLVMECMGACLASSAQQQQVRSEMAPFSS